MNRAEILSGMVDTLPSFSLGRREEESGISMHIQPTSAQLYLRNYPRKFLVRVTNNTMDCEIWAKERCSHTYMYKSAFIPLPNR